MFRVLWRILLVGSLAFTAFSGHAGDSGSPDRDKAARIVISDLKVIPVAAGSCKVVVSLTAEYSGAESGPEPDLWHLLPVGTPVDGKQQVIFGRVPVKESKANDSQIVVKDKEIDMNIMGGCRGSGDLEFWISDGDLKSEKSKISVTFPN